MADLISRADAIGAVHEYYQKRFTEDSKWDADAKMFVLEDKTIAKDNMEICNIINALPSAKAEYRTTVPPLPKGQVIVSQKGGNNRNGDDCDGIMPLCRTCTQDVSDWRLCRRICCKYGDDCDGRGGAKMKGGAE